MLEGPVETYFVYREKLRTVDVAGLDAWLELSPASRDMKIAHITKLEGAD